MCSMATNQLSVYVSRKKVVLSGEFIDTSIPQNRDFLKRRQEKYGQKQPANPSQETKQPSKPNVKEPVIESSAPEIDFPDDDDSGSSYAVLDKKEKALNIKKKREEIEILKVKKEKLHGVLIPTDLVKVLMAQHYKSVSTAFQHASDNLIMEMSKKKKLNRNEVAELRGHLVKIINKAVNDSIDDSKDNIKNIVSEYSERRGVGERK